MKPESTAAGETLPILYADDVLVVVNKPSGLLVHRSPIDRHETRFAVQLLRNQLGRRVHPVHRLDKGASGAMVFALDRTTAGTLAAAFASQQVQKTYLAIVRGWPAASGRCSPTPRCAPGSLRAASTAPARSPGRRRCAKCA